MSVLESSDRRMSWEARVLRSGEEMSPSCREQTLSAGYFIGEQMEALELKDVAFEGVGVFGNQFVGGRWIRVNAAGLDLSQTVFRHVFFEKVDFSETSFQTVRFEHCVFLDCQVGQAEPRVENPVLIDCHFVVRQEETAPPLVRPAVETTTAPAPLAKAPITEKVADRFAGLER